MAIGIRVTVDDGSTGRMLAAWMQVAGGIVGEASEMLELLVKKEIKAADLLFRRTLLNSVTSQIVAEGTGAGREVRGEVYSEEVHAPVMEYGRRAGAEMPPVKALMPWVEKKLKGAALFSPTKSGNPKAGAAKARRRRPNKKAVRRLAFAVARSIAKKGIKPRKPFNIAADKVEQQLPQIADRYIAKFVESL